MDLNGENKISVDFRPSQHEKQHIYKRDPPHVEEDYKRNPHSNCV